jgi:hypothetical protein
MEKQPMTRNAWFVAATPILLLTTPSYAGPCQHSIDRVQAQVDAAIDKRAGSGPWLPESVDATRNYQPTPRSIAAAEGDRRLQSALNSLNRARAADNSRNVTLCDAELKKARRALRLP